MGGNSCHSAIYINKLRNSGGGSWMCRLLKKCNSFFSFLLSVYENKSGFTVCICSKHLHSSEYQEFLWKHCDIKHKLY